MNLEIKEINENNIPSLVPQPLNFNDEARLGKFLRETIKTGRNEIGKFDWNTKEGIKKAICTLEEQEGDFELIKQAMAINGHDLSFLNEPIIKLDKNIKDLKFYTEL